MKRLYIGVVLLIAVLAAGIFLTLEFSALHRPLSEKLEAAAEAALSENWTDAVEQASGAKADWERLRCFTAAVADHEPLEQMDALFAQLEVLSGTKDTQEFALVCRQLAVLSTALADSQSIRWWNLL